MLMFIDKKYLLVTSNLIKLIIFIITISFLFINKEISAEELRNIISQQDLIIRSQQSFNEFDARQKEQQEVNDDFERKESQIIDEEIIDDEDKNIVKRKCKIINQIIFSNANILSSATKQNLIADITGKCFNNKKFSQLIEKISDIYDQNGFITTEVEMLQDRIDKGIIEIKIIEKTIEKITLNYLKSSENSIAYRLQKHTAFGFIEGSKLNSNDLAQGIYQLNRLNTNHSSYKITTGSNRDKNQIIIDNRKKFPAYFSANHDNFGNNATGIYRSSFHSNFDNLFALNENINLSYSTNLNDSNNSRDIKSYLANLYFPLAYYSLSIEGSRSDFYGLDSLNRNFSGYSNRYSIILNKLFTDNLDYRISAKIGFTQKETASYLQENKIDNSQRRLTILNLNILATYFIDKNSTIFFKPSIIQGLDNLGSHRDSNYNNPKLNFTIFKIYTSMQKNFRAFNLNRPIHLVSEIDSQMSNKTLFGSEQIAIGGYTTVRGFREQNNSGDSGFYWRNKLELNLGSIISKTPFQVNHHLNNTKIEPFIDYGYIRKKFDSKPASMSGIGFRTAYNHNNFSGSLTFAWALKQSRLATNYHKENKMIYFEIATRCCLF